MSRICEHVETFFRHIRSCIVNILQSIRHEFCMHEENRNIIGKKVATVDHFTNCDKKSRVTMSCQTDGELFKQALAALGQSANDDTRTTSKTMSGTTKGSTENTEIHDRSTCPNFNENCSLCGQEDNTPSSGTNDVQVTRSPETIARDDSPIQPMGLVDQMNKRHIMENKSNSNVGFIFTSVSNTTFHDGKRSVGTSPLVEYANSCSQTFMTIAPKAIYFPVYHTKTPAVQVPVFGESEKGAKAKSPPKKENNDHKKREPEKSTSTEKKKTDSHLAVGTDTEVVSEIGGVKDEKTCVTKEETETLSHQTVTVADQTQLKTETKIGKNLKKAVDDDHNMVKAENEMVPKQSEVKTISPYFASPKTGGSGLPSPILRTTEQTDSSNIYTRENYIKVMLLKIVEKLPHIKKMKARQDSLPEDDPERERLYRAINNEIKKNIHQSLDKFYVRYNQLHPSQRTNTLELEKTFLMDLITEMKKADKDFLVEEKRAHDDSHIRKKEESKEEHVVKKMDIDQVKGLEANSNQSVKKAQEMNEQASETVSACITELKSQEEVTIKPKRHRHRHRKTVVKESPAPLENFLAERVREPQPQYSEPEETKVQPEKDKPVTPEPTLALKRDASEEDHTSDAKIDVSEAESTCNEEGAIMDFMRDMENEASRDGLFANWDGTPFGDIGYCFDRSHYRIDGQAMVSKGKKGFMHKADGRPQKIKRRGIPNKHLTNTTTCNYLQESAGETLNYWELEENVLEVDSADIHLEDKMDGLPDDNPAEEILSCLGAVAADADHPTNPTVVAEEAVADTRHLQTNPCDVILKKKGECDLLEERYAVDRPQKHKVRQKKKKPKKTTIYAVNYSNNAAGENSDDDSDDYEDSDSDDDEDSGSSSYDDTDSDETEDEEAYKARIAKYTEMLQSIHYSK